jgi:PHD/YefM family antitoxin component YafN of YafNO toxin-antitoxin module
MAGGVPMAKAKSPTTVTVSDARARLYRPLDEAALSHRPILITGKRANAVLLSEDDW